MINKILVSFMICLLALTIESSGQLSEKVIDEITAKRAQYLNISNHRKSSLSKILKQHEQNRNLIFQSTNDLKSRLQSENQRFQSELSSILSENEVVVYNTLEHLRFEDDRQYVKSLLRAVSSDVYIKYQAKYEYWDKVTV
jgi:outer membrane lipoprotein-sorting protein